MLLLGLLGVNRDAGLEKMTGSVGSRGEDEKSSSLVGGFDVDQFLNLEEDGKRLAVTEPEEVTSATSDKSAFEGPGHLDLMEEETFEDEGTSSKPTTQGRPITVEIEAVFYYIRSVAKLPPGVLSRRLGEGK